MRRQLVVHIGTPKTGSSALQRALFSGAFSVEGLAVAYPSWLNDVALAQALIAGDEERAKRAFRRIRRWLRSTDAEVNVVSAEQLSMVPPRTFREALARNLPAWEGDSRVVCYLRPHGPRVLAAFGQRRMSGAYRWSFDEFVNLVTNRAEFQYAALVGSWQAEFGDRFVPRLATRDALVGGDVVADFLHLVTSGAPVRVPAGRVHRTLSVDALALMDFMHRALTDAGAPITVARLLAKRVSADLNSAGVADHGRRLWIPADQAARLVDLYADDAARTDALCFDGRTPLTDALEGLADHAPDEPLEIRPTELRPADGAALRADADRLAEVGLVHGAAWTVSARHAKGRRSRARGAQDLRSAALVEAAIEPVVTKIVEALRPLPPDAPRS